MRETMKWFLYWIIVIGIEVEKIMRIIFSFVVYLNLGEGLVFIISGLGICICDFDFKR